MPEWFVALCWAVWALGMLTVLVFSIWLAFL